MKNLNTEKDIGGESVGKYNITKNAFIPLFNPNRLYFTCLSSDRKVSLCNNIWVQLTVLSPAAVYVCKCSTLSHLTAEAQIHFDQKPFALSTPSVSMNGRQAKQNAT